ncbi:Pumilio, RNA binding domain [Sesbania bispinosa]|nr:Pumilio, RNA binding domain [Sesbania bispinosa]
MSSLIDNDESSPESFNLSRLLTQQQNLSPKNQTLENAFSRLSVSASPYNHPSFDYGGSSALDGFTGFYPRQSSNLGQTQGSLIGFNKPVWNNINGETLLQNSWVGGDRDSGNLNSPLSGSYPTFNGGVNGFLDSVPLLRQREFGNTVRNVPLSNGLRVNSRGGGGFLNGFSSSVPGVVFNGRSLQWYSGLPVLSLAKDQYGCRILQETMKTLPPEDFEYTFSQLINHVTDLMVDPFGNYVVQKMVDICNEEQRSQIISRVIEHSYEFIRLCLNPHGSRAVEKLLEHVTTQEQRAQIISTLRSGTVVLAKDINGHRVFLHLLKHFSQEDNKYLLNEVANNCYAISIDKTGCCVLQQCISYAQGETKTRLIADIIVNASVLAEDCYGNYVVQHLLSMKIPGVTESLLRQLEGKFVYLACNKYGSNVVEKFFQDSDELHSTRIILELLQNPDVAKLLVDPYGNYVIKSALLVSKVSAH